MITKTREEIQAEIANFAKALKEQQEIIKEHKRNADFCKMVIKTLKADLEYLDLQDETAKLLKTY